MRIALLAAALTALAVSASAQPKIDTGPISPQRLSADVKVLADARLAGRAPGGPGEAGTLAYLEAQFKAAGLKPAGDAGGWTQAVPLIRFRVDPAATRFALTSSGRTRPLAETKDVMVWTQRPVSRVQVEKAPLVFVGYGVTAPERGWDDFKGVDLKGKIAVVLINDPDFEAKPGEPVAGKFGGLAATYYGRWIYKFEEIARRGGLGCIIVHETAGAAYPWSTVVASNGDSYDVVRTDADKVHPLIQGWMQRDLAVQLFKQAGLDFEAEKVRARTYGFRPVALKGASFSADFPVKTDRLTSHNVLAEIPGTTHPDETVTFAAHWDAFGQGPPDASGDTVRHGAIDDGMGVAGVLEIARAFSHGPRPQRTLVFGVWTAEERGLLGSEYYATHPKFPLATSVANFTMDVVQTAGPSRDLVLVGNGKSSLDKDLAAAAAKQHRTITPDPHPEKALFYRADHFSVAKRGVPTELIMGMAAGPDLLAGGRAAGDKWVNDYTTRCYHQVCDNWSAAWDLRGAAQDIDLFYEVGKALANSREWPTWNAGSEFKAVREKTAALRK
ncbi:M28 family metallopeptidase [Phenylobacterium sp.]|jgi:Zn-dependent M28 family amino/carboxypeptidase|uniref:M28 family metallopeptidase n=1 Tax=Phenylobacterium sp. TaxID=1871053 RepID=UPI002F3FD0F4